MSHFLQTCARRQKAGRGLAGSDRSSTLCGLKRNTKSKLVCISLVAAAALNLPTHGEDLAQHYARYGQLKIVRLAAAPFPHPARAEGHRYKSDFYPAREHYTDSSVAIFVPTDFRAKERIDVVVHFHGWKNQVERVLQRYQLIEQFSAARRNAILVVPQGPRNAPDSFGGKLEDADGFRRFIAETLAVVRTNFAISPAIVPGQIVLSGHSGGYHVISSILAHGGLTDHIKEVWLFDALYGETEKFLAWSGKRQGRFINIYTESGGTKKETEQMMERLKERGQALLTGGEADVALPSFASNQFVFLTTLLGHDEVVAGHQMFEKFLKTSCLAELPAAR